MAYLLQSDFAWLSEWTGRRFSNIGYFDRKSESIRYAKKLQEQGARNVLVSMAGDGAVLVTEDGQEFKANAPKGKLKNSVGAGDSMVAGFVYGYLKSNDYKQAFIYGVCTGSASAFSEELATKPEVEALIDKWDSASN